MIYEIPKEYFFRLHQVRPRFKNDVESVLLYVSTEISKLGTMQIDTFNSKLFIAIKQYPGNAIKTDKTIDNWRTEIAALFGLILENNTDGIAEPGKIALKLANEQDLVQFFKYFLFYFQYPGGHIKSHKLKEVIAQGVRFKPAQYFLKVLSTGEKLTGKRFSINKAEATHFIYNDLRATRDNRDPQATVEIIMHARRLKTQLDWSGDTIRYAGDILDYMIIANLLVLHGSDYYINWSERETIVAFIESNSWFEKYDTLYGTDFDVSILRFFEDDWFKYVNTDLGEELFRTDVFKYLGIEDESYKQLEEAVEIDHDNIRNTKEIGNYGEHLIFGHECMRVKIGGRQDLIHLIKKIPTALAVGYDIQSVELDSIKRYIEVKTTVSNKSINFYNFHLTPNEWCTAETTKDRYFVYRLMLSREEKKLFIIQDPVSLYKSDRLNMSPRNGADIVFKENAGEWSELLIWKN